MKAVPRHKLMDFALLCGLAYGIYLWTFWLVSVPLFWQRAAAGDLPSLEVNGIAPASLAEAGSIAWRVSMANWAVINTTINGLSFVTFSLLALLVGWRVRTGFGLLTAFVLLLAGSDAMGMVVHSVGPPVVAAKAWQLGALVWPLFFIWLFLFSDGQMVPARVGWLLVPMWVLFTTFIALGEISSVIADNSTLSQLGWLAASTMLLVALGAQAYRYWRRSSPATRQQTKWFLLGALCAFAPPLFLRPLLGYPAEVDTLAFSALPLGIGISILRYRLWDFTLVIRRTLLYVALTIVLSALYFSSVIVLQTIFLTLSGTQSPAALVVSTLVVAALFHPIRRRLQQGLDRRFFRRKYDAALVLARFAATTRNQLSLESLTDELRTVVQESMEPDGVTVWLKEQPGQRRR